MFLEEALFVFRDRHHLPSAFLIASFLDMVSDSMNCGILHGAFNFQHKLGCCPRSRHPWNRNLGQESAKQKTSRTERVKWLKKIENR